MSPSPLSLSSSRGLFVTGTDTGVGKTHVACRLIELLHGQGLRVAAMKPVAAGVEADGMNEDVRRLLAASNVEAPPELVNPYSFVPAIAPHIAARQAGVTMDLEVVADAYAELAGHADVVVVEGAGGFLVPFNEACGMDAIPVRLGLPVVMVVGLRLGCLNHAQLTAEAIAARGLPMIGWVANHVDPDMQMAAENMTGLHGILRSPCLGEIRWQETSPGGLAAGSPLILKALGLQK